MRGKVSSLTKMQPCDSAIVQRQSSDHWPVPEEMQHDAGTTKQHYTLLIQRDRDNKRVNEGKSKRKIGQDSLHIYTYIYICIYMYIYNHIYTYVFIYYVYIYSYVCVSFFLHDYLSLRRRNSIRMKSLFLIVKKRFHGFWDGSLTQVPFFTYSHCKFVTEIPVKRSQLKEKNPRQHTVTHCYIFWLVVHWHMMHRCSLDPNNYVEVCCSVALRCSVLHCVALCSSGQSRRVIIIQHETCIGWQHEARQVVTSPQYMVHLKSSFVWHTPTRVLNYCFQ